MVRWGYMTEPAGVCVDGRLKQPQLAQSDWTLGEAAHLLHIEQSVSHTLSRVRAQI